MAVINRKVSFYRLSLVKENKICGHEKSQTHALSNAEMEEQFAYIYREKMYSISNGRKAMEVDTYHSKYVIEVISFSAHRTFLKIGQQNSANTVALRDRNTLETENVPMRESQMLELYTFCWIDFETGIVSYIGINGAPRITAIQNMFYNSLYKERKIHAEFAAILTDDIVDRIRKKGIISGLSVTIAVPSDDILSNRMGVNATTFDALRNVKARVATFKISGKRNKNIFDSSNKLAELVADLKSAYGDSIMALNARAKDPGEKSQNYDLLQYNFTKTVSLGDGDSTLLDETDFKEALTKVYETYKDELLRYSKI